MKNWDREGSRLVFVAPEGGVESGVLVSIGSCVVAPLYSKEEGQEFVGIITGVIKDLKKLAGFAATTGTSAYWNSTTGNIEGVDTTNNRRIGVFADDCASGDLYCSVRLDGISLGAAGDVEDKISKVSPAVAGHIAILTAAGSLEDGGPVPEGGGGGVEIYADFATLKAVPTAGSEYGDPPIITPGTPVAVGAITFPGGDAPPDLPWFMQWWSFDLSTFDLSSQDAFEPALVIPDDQWGDDPYGNGPMAGAWVNLFSLLSGDSGSSATEIMFPLPLNISPDPELCEEFGGLQEGYKFLTGPEHDEAYKVATWNGSSWDFADPEEGAAYKFSGKWALPGGSQRFFAIGFAPSYTPKWQLRDYELSTYLPYTPVLNGFAHQPSDLSSIPQLGEVYLVQGPGAGPWEFKSSFWAWLDGDGESWVFSSTDGALGGLLADGSMSIIRDTETEELYPVLYSAGHSRWTQQGGGTTWEDTELNYVQSAGVGVPVVIERAFGPGNYLIPALPYDCKLIDIHVVCTATYEGGQATLYGHSGAQVTGPMVCQNENIVGRASTIYRANTSLPTGDHFYFSSSGVSGIAYLTIVRTA